ncbi:MAG: GNAT family N-acetyltransferase, partial [Gammaproteobacteria bacterium]|nr:GNAT family N-acetyltransferase [Gammaproteobacteria bacterium]
MNRDDSIKAALDPYRNDIRKAGYRGMVVISGEMQWCYQVAEQAMWLDENSLWIGKENDYPVKSITAKACQQHLGREHADVVFDAWQGLDPDALGAISGTLKSGCILYLLTPPFEQWESFDDPEYKRIIVEPYESKDAGRRFIRHIMDVLTTTDDILIWREGEEKIIQKLQTADKAVEMHVDAPYKTLDQKQAVEAIEKVIKGHRRRPLLLQADRGRGKSSALGLAAAKYMSKANGKIGVTAPGRVQANEIFARIKEVHPESEQHGMKISVGDAELEFYAPDEILDILPKLNLLLIDEAAAIPLSMLEKMLLNYSRIVYATTVHGYEGTGKGFEIKFKQTLRRHCDKWNEIYLHTPIRWCAGDILEAVISKMLLLDAENSHRELEFNDEDIKISPISRSELASSSHTLQDWFGLLVDAHYKTRPYDLRQILDGPNIKIWNVYAKEKIVATAVVAMEGLILDEHDVTSIYQGKRRLHGHLMPQTLVVHSGHKNAFDFNYARIIRVAVHEAYRRRGIGSRLICAIENWAMANGKDYLSVSYGADKDLMKFWKCHNYELVRIGLKKEASNGQHNLMMMKEINNN